jgi:hypothetical protein
METMTQSLTEEEEEEDQTLLIEATMQVEEKVRGLKVQQGQSRLLGDNNINNKVVEEVEEEEVLLHRIIHCHRLVMILLLLLLLLSQSMRNTNDTHLFLEIFFLIHLERVLTQIIQEITLQEVLAAI